MQANRKDSLDNTNRDADTRKYWIALARSFKIPIRCVLFTAEPGLCEHNNAVRALGGNMVRQRMAKPPLSRGRRLKLTWAKTQLNPEGRSLLPKQAFTCFQSGFVTPSLAEGFEDVTRVNFKVSRLRRLDYYGLAAPSPFRRRSMLSPVLCKLYSSRVMKEARKYGVSIGYELRSGKDFG